MSDSALRSLEELERLYREHAIQAPPIQQEPPKWVGTSLGIAEVPLLVAEGDLEEIIETPSVVPIPKTKPWVLGVASHMGALLPIVSGDVFFRRQPYQGRVREWCMVVRRQGFRFGMTLSSVERDLKFPLEQLDMDGPVDPDFAAFARGGFYHRDRFIAVLDMERLLADTDLADASAPDSESIEEQTNE
jgi:twitching motility protein PilI